MKTSTIGIETRDGVMDLYVAEPDGGADRAVIVVQEAFGVNGHIEDVARRFADEGYLGVAPHLFHRTGGGTVDYGNFEGVMPHFRALSDDAIVADLDGTLAYLSSRDISAARTAVVGFCFGGRVSFLAAVSRPLGAAVGFYGGGIVDGRSDAMPSLAPRVPDMPTPWLGLFGDADSHIPVESVERLRDALQGAPVDTDVVRYPDADHGFHCDVRPSYHQEAAADAWRRTLEWIGPRLGA